MTLETERKRTEEFAYSLQNKFDSIKTELKRDDSVTVNKLSDVANAVKRIKDKRYKVGDKIVEENLQPVSFKKYWDINLKSSVYCICVEDVIYAGLDNGNVVKVSSAGEKLWEISLGMQILRISFYKGYIYVLGRDEKIFKLSDTGEKIKEKSTGYEHRDMTIDEDGFIYIACPNSKLLKFDNNFNKVLEKDVYKAWSINHGKNYLYMGTSDGDICKMSKSGEMIWRQSRHGRYIVRYIIADEHGNVYSAGDNGYLAKSCDNGDCEWEYGVNGDAYSVDIDNLGYCYAGNENGGIDKISSTGKKIWLLQLNKNYNFIHDLKIFENYLYMACGDGTIKKYEKSRCGKILGK